MKTGCKTIDSTDYNSGQVKALNCFYQFFTVIKGNLYI